MTSRPEKGKKRPSGRQMMILHRIHAEFSFSGETLRQNIRGMWFGLLTGLVVGLCGSVFVRLLQYAAQFREDVWWASLLLPAVGLAVVWLYRRGGIRTAGGTDLIVQAARGEQPVSRVLAPVIFLSTLLTHAFGGSAGREGAALQLGGSLAELIRKALRIENSFEDLAIMCGMSAGFSAVFGSQISAVIFALEISCVGLLPLGALFPCAVSSITAGMVARRLGVHGVSYFLSASTPTVLFYGKVLLLGIVCGLLSIVVCYTFSGVRTALETLLPDPYRRVLVGGAAVVLLTLCLGTHHYLGSGQEMIDQAVSFGEAGAGDFLWKLILTALTLGAGLKGGEIVPSFAIGASFGCVLGPLLGLPAPYAAATGMVALFCGVTNCPLTALVLGFEVFLFCSPGGFLVAVAASFLVSGYGGLYSKQKFAFSKAAAPEGTLADEDRFFDP